MGIYDYYDNHWDNVGKYEWQERLLEEKEHGDTQRHHRGLDKEPSEQPTVRG